MENKENQDERIASVVDEMLPAIHGGHAQENEKGVPTSNESIHSAIQREREIVILALRENMGNPISRIVLSLYGAENESVESILENIQDIHERKSYATSALVFAAEEGDEEAVKVLLKHGADVNTVYGHWKEIALMKAAEGGHEKVVELLVQHGAKVNKGDEGDATALMRAAGIGYVGIVRILLAAEGIKVDKGDECNITALMYAASGGHVEIVNILLSSGADINFADDNGNTALMHAAYEGKSAAIKTLLAHDADALMKNKEGETAEDFARKKGHDDIVTLLQEAEKQKAAGNT